MNDEALNELKPLLNDITTIKCQTGFDRQNRLMVRNKKGDSFDKSLLDMDVDSVMIKLYDKRSVLDMWGVAYKGHSANVGLDVEEGVVSCYIKISGDRLVIECDAPRD